MDCYTKGTKLMKNYLKPIVAVIKSLYFVWKRAKAGETVNQILGWEDIFTGLPLQRKLHYDLSHSAKDYALIYADLDNFKYFNDNYSHEYADEMLKNVASLMKRIIANRGQIYRLYSSGDEFCVLVKNTNAQLLAKEIQVAVNRELGLGISIGIAKSNSDSALSNADLSLLRAKKIEGKNMIVIYESLGKINEYKK